MAGASEGAVAPAADDERVALARASAARAHKAVREGQCHEGAGVPTPNFNSNSFQQQHGFAAAAAAAAAAGGAAGVAASRVADAARRNEPLLDMKQGLTLVHFSAQPESFLEFCR